MPEPTLLACFLGCVTLNKIVETATGGFLGGIGGTPFEAIRKQVVRLYGERDLAKNHVLQRAIRRSYLQATIALCDEALVQKGCHRLSLMEKVRKHFSQDAEAQPFERIRASLLQELEQTRRESYVVPPSQAVEETPLLLRPGSAQEQITALQNALKQELYVELVRFHAAQNDPNQEPLRTFHCLLGDRHEGETSPCRPAKGDWFALLCAFFRQEIKSNPEVAAIFQSEILADLAAQGRPITQKDLENALEKSSNGLAERLDAIEATLNRQRSENYELWASLRAQSDAVSALLVAVEDLGILRGVLEGVVREEAEKTRQHTTQTVGESEKRVTATIERGLEEIKRELEKELDVSRNTIQFQQGQIQFLQGQIATRDQQITFLQTLHSERPQPSERARELAKEIPDDADAYALALKAIAEQNYGEARRLLLAVIAEEERKREEELRAREEKDRQLARLYQTAAENEFYDLHYAEAVVYARKALALLPDDADMLHRAAYYLHWTGKYDEAIPLQERALTLQQQALPEGHPSIATSLNNLAALYQAQGHYSEAEPLFRQTLEIDRLALGENHPGYATDLNNLAGLYESQGRYAEAEPLYLQALEIRRHSLPEGHPLIAGSLNNLAGLYYAQSRYAEAETLYLQALEIRQKSLPEGHPDIGQSLNNLALLYQAQGRYAEAETHYQRALAIMLKSLGAQHPNTITVLENFLILLEEQGRPEAFAPFLEQYPAILETLTLPMSRNQQEE